MEKTKSETDAVDLQDLKYMVEEDTEKLTAKTP
jgi:hypothetical protein